MCTVQPRLLSALALLLTLALLVRASTIEHKKSLVPDSEFGPLVRRFVGDGNCTGYLKDVCPGRLVLGLHVRMTDPLSENYGRIVLNEPLRSVLLFRTPNELGLCPGRVDIDVRHACPGQEDRSAPDDDDADIVPLPTF